MAVPTALVLANKRIKNFRTIASRADVALSLRKMATPGPKKQFEITIRGKDKVPLEFENQAHEEFFDKLQQMKVCFAIAPHVCKHGTAPQGGCMLAPSGKNVHVQLVPARGDVFSAADSADSCACRRTRTIFLLTSFILCAASRLSMTGATRSTTSSS